MATRNRAFPWSPCQGPSLPRLILASRGLLLWLGPVALRTAVHFWSPWVRCRTPDSRKWKDTMPLCCNRARSLSVPTLQNTVLSIYVHLCQAPLCFSFVLFSHEYVTGMVLHWKLSLSISHLNRLSTGYRNKTVEFLKATFEKEKILIKPSQGLIL